MGNVRTDGGAQERGTVVEVLPSRFRLTTSGKEQGYAEFAVGHRDIYQTPISYRFEYDDAAWVEADDRVAARVWTTTRQPGEPTTRIEVILIASYLDGRIHRLWELAWPDWSQLKVFEQYP